MLARTSVKHKLQDAEAKITTQKITAETLHAFLSKLRKEDWEDVRRSETADAAYEAFISIFKRIYHEHFILITQNIKKGKGRKPWVNRECIKRIKQKTRLFKKFLKSRLDTDFDIFRQYRNKLTSFLRSEKNKYLHDQFRREYCNQTGDVWKKLNKLLNRTQPPSTVDDLVINGKRICGKELAEAFNKFFRDAVSIGQCIPPATYGIKENKHSIYLEPTDEHEVRDIYASFKNSRARDIDDIQIEPVKFVLDVIAPLLAHIYNLAIATGCFPKMMQISKVSVLHKKGDRNELSNYRPISVLPIFSKGLEKIIHKRITKFSHAFNLINESQHGFLHGKSTESALLTQKEIILKAFELKQICVGIYIDFSKAFDRIQHATLLEKLQLYGIRGVPLLLIKSYLKHRFQCVSIGTAVSSLQQVVTGVPQGSILGPLLFILYINDINTINKTPTYVIYADDTSLFFTGKNLQILAPEINNALEDIQKWSKENSLLINDKKTKAVLFHPRQLSVTIDSSLFLGTAPIEFVNSIKILGVLFQKNMSWDDHFDHVQSHVAKSVGAIAKFRHILPVSIKLMLYNTLFLSHINYCFLVWGNSTQRNNHRILMLQKRALRSIANVEYHAHTKDLFHRFNVVPIEKFYDWKLAIRYKKAVYKNQHDLLNLANLRGNVPFYSLRKQDFWNIPFCRTEYGRQMLQYCLPHLLNTLLRSEIEVEKRSISHIKKHFL